eukprot:c15695_g2_i1.p3 GENE.c15695_g2_i1~~c15695_g2_i1.p3  ORF type:complete len:107 (+),score=15.61 c15695_g2_i1:2-322(+)
MHRLEQAGAARKVLSGEISLVSGVRLVAKELEGPDEKKYRPVFRLMQLNERLPDRKFKLEHLDVLIASVGKGWWGGGLDIADAYYHCPVHRDSCRWLGVEVAEESE